MKKLLPLCLALCLVLTGCTGAPETIDHSKLQIVCTCFPAYDFARAVAGDRAQLLLLIKPGAEVHSYEPTPKDMARIQSCDLFICNGGESEEWVEELTEAQLYTVCMMDCAKTVEESDEGIYKTEGGEEDEVELDEHVWTSPKNAELICREIFRALCELDPAHAREYERNLKSISSELTDLDAQFTETVRNAKRSVLIFADRFPMRYFTLEYGLNYFAAFPGCSTETEPSAKTVAFLIDKVRENNIPAVLTMEFSNEKMADIICEDTGCKKLPFYSAHSVTAEQFSGGVTYCDLMRINLSSLKEALG